MPGKVEEGGPAFELAERRMVEVLGRDDAELKDWVAAANWVAKHCKREVGDRELVQRLLEEVRLTEREDDE